MQVDTQYNLSDIQKDIILRYQSDPQNHGILDGKQCSQKLVDELNRSSQEVLDHSIWSLCIKRWKDFVRKDYWYTKKLRSNVFSFEDLQLLLHIKDSLDEAAENWIKHENEVTCRTCLANIDEQQTCNLFTTFVEENHTLATLLNTFTKVFGVKRDDYSPLICFQCSKTLKMMHNFREMCEKNDFNLRQFTVIEKPDIIHDNNISVHQDELLTERNDEVQEFLLDTIDFPIKSEISTQHFTENYDSINEIKPSPSQTSHTVGKMNKMGKNWKNSDNLIFDCDKCDKNYDNYNSLITHKRRLHMNLPQRTSNPNKPKKTIECEACGKFYSTYSSLSIHKQRLHPNLPKKKKLKDECTTCDECGKTYKSRSSLYSHKMNFHREIQKPFGCDICGKHFRTKSDISIHVLTHNSGLSCTCEICGKGFKTPNNLRNHVRRHRAEKDVHCNLCPYVTNSKENLKIHIRIHSGEKPYACEYCSSSFRTASNRSKHIQLVHKKLRPYKCTMCDKTFATESKSKNHIVAHTGAKPYQCLVCMKAFRWNQSLRKHMIKHLKRSGDTEREAYTEKIT